MTDGRAVHTVTPLPSRAKRRELPAREIGRLASRVAMTRGQDALAVTVTAGASNAGRCFIADRYRAVCFVLIPANAAMVASRCV